MNSNPKLETIHTGFLLDIYNIDISFIENKGEDMKKTFAAILSCLLILMIAASCSFGTRIEKNEFKTAGFDAGSVGNWVAKDESLFIMIPSPISFIRI